MVRYEPKVGDLVAAYRPVHFRTVIGVVVEVSDFGYNIKLLDSGEEMFVYVYNISEVIPKDMTRIERLVFKDNYVHLKNHL